MAEETRVVLTVCQGVPDYQPRPTLWAMVPHWQELNSSVVSAQKISSCQFLSLEKLIPPSTPPVPQPGHERAQTGKGRRETLADSNQLSEGVDKAVPEQRPAVRSFLLTGGATRCGNDNKKRPPGEPTEPCTGNPRASPALNPGGVPLR